MRRELCCLAFFATNQIHPAFSISMQRGEAQVTTNHAFTGRMCAASRYEETRRPDSLFVDELGALLAGKEGLDQPMGAWILVPRTRRGDDFLVERYKNFGARQLVLLGAGMDARAFRSFPVSGSSSVVSWSFDPIKNQKHASMCAASTTMPSRVASPIKGLRN